jgi:RNA polymerase sigma-70 factor (ECF subfamily)
VEDGSFQSFYQSEYHAVLSLARALTGDDMWAEDVTHDTFLAAFRSWGELDNPSGWVRRVASNQARSGWRRRYAEGRALDRMHVDAVVGDDVPAETEEFWARVRALPKRQAQAIALFYLEDRPVAEVAVILGCAESTARKHLSRGRRSLQRVFRVDQ